MNFLKIFLVVALGLMVTQTTFSMEQDEKKERVKRKHTKQPYKKSKKNKVELEDEREDSKGKSEQSVEESLEDLAPIIGATVELSETKQRNENKKFIENEPLLYSAVREGSLESVKSLLKNGFSPNACIAKYNATALHKAVVKRDIEIIKLLLLWGADPRLQTVAGWTPLYYAVFNNRLDVVEVLLNFLSTSGELEKLEYLCKRFPAFKKQVLAFLIVLKRIKIKTRLFVPKPVQKIIIMSSMKFEDQDDYCLKIWFGSDPKATITEMVNREDNYGFKPSNLINIDAKIITMMRPYVEKNK